MKIEHLNNEVEVMVRRNLALHKSEVLTELEEHLRMMPKGSKKSFGTALLEIRRLAILAKQEAK